MKDKLNACRSKRDFRKTTESSGASGIPHVFSDDEYLSLDTDGPRAMHLCAFALRFEAKEVLVATARWFA